jgi:ABC-type antimicrobial peptide transport system permease subunit
VAIRFIDQVGLTFQFTRRGNRKPEARWIGLDGFAVKLRRSHADYLDRHAVQIHDAADQAVATLAAFFGLLALTSVGLYGLLAYLVQRRTSEIGIRMALGARRGMVVGMVIRDALGHATVGILMGIPITFAVTRLMAHQLYGVRSADPATTSAAVLLLIGCLAVAAYLPARRASRIDPIRGLRQD